MTEREKRIEEMARCRDCLDRCYKRVNFLTGETKRASDSDVEFYRRYCQVWKVAEKNVEEDYRKADEVRKETAKDIIYGVANLVEIIEPDEEVAKHIYYHLFEDCKEYGLNEKEFADKFGVEVEE